MVNKEKNKWQGGCLSRDGKIFAIPSNAKEILCIDTAIPDNNIVSDEMKYSFVGNFQPKKDKWQGMRQILGKANFGTINFKLHLMCPAFSWYHQHRWFPRARWLYLLHTSK